MKVEINSVMHLLISILVFVTVLEFGFAPPKLPSSYWLVFLIIGLTYFIISLVDFLRKYQRIVFSDGLFGLSFASIGLSNVILPRHTPFFSYLGIICAGIALGWLISTKSYQTGKSDWSGARFLKIFAVAIGILIAMLISFVSLYWLVSYLSR